MRFCVIYEKQHQLWTKMFSLVDLRISMYNLLTEMYKLNVERFQRSAYTLLVEWCMY